MEPLAKVVVPPSPPRSPGTRQTQPPMIGMTFFNDFFGIQKIIKNRLLKKHIFFRIFFSFGENNEKSAKNEGRLGSPMGSFFDVFSGI